MAYRSLTSGGYASRTEVQPAAPSGLAAGDCVLVFIYLESLTETVTAPSGGAWTQLYAAEIDSTADEDFKAYVFYYGDVSAADVTNWTTDAVSLFDLSASTPSAFMCTAHSGRSATPIDDSDLQENESWSALPSASATASAADADLVGVCMDYLGTGTGVPSGWTDRLSQGSTDLDTLDGEGSGSKSYAPTAGAGRGRAVILVILAAGGGPAGLPPAGIQINRAVADASLH